MAELSENIFLFVFYFLVISVAFFFFCLLELSRISFEIDFAQLFILMLDKSTKQLKYQNIHLRNFPAHPPFLFSV
jgi:hypothetical protein